MSKPNSFLIIILLANHVQMVAAEEAPARVKSRLEMTLSETPVLIAPKEIEPRRKSPLEPYSPKYYYEMQTEQTSPVHKTYFDEVKKKLVTLDPTTGFLYRNSGTDNLEAVLQEDSFGSLDEVEFGIAYDDGIPQSLRSNFKKVETATTSSGYKTVETLDTKQTISYEPSREMLMKNKVTGKWEAVRREFPPMIDKPKATNRESTRSNATESRYIPSTGQWQETMREPDRMPQSSTQRQSTLGEQVAGGVKRQLERAIGTVQQNYGENANSGTSSHGGPDHGNIHNWKTPPAKLSANVPTAKAPKRSNYPTVVNNDELKYAEYRSPTSGRAAPPSTPRINWNAKTASSSGTRKTATTSTTGVNAKAGSTRMRPATSYQVVPPKVVTPKYTPPAARTYPSPYYRPSTFHGHGH